MKLALKANELKFRLIPDCSTKILLRYDNKKIATIKDGGCGKKL
jgi:hypothetical protein